MLQWIRHVAVLAVVAIGVGCGDKDKGPGQPAASSGGTPKAATPSAPADPKSAVGVWNADMAPLIAIMKPMMEMAAKMAESMAGEAANTPEAKKQLEESKKNLAKIDQMKMQFTLKAGGTGTMDAMMPGDEGGDESTGTLAWSQAGDQVTITLKTNNGKPVEGKKAETKVFTLKGNEMSMSDDGMLLTFKRK